MSEMMVGEKGIWIFEKKNDFLLLWLIRENLSLKICPSVANSAEWLLSTSA